MTETQKQALIRALAFLKASGASYIVLEPNPANGRENEGETHTVHRSLDMADWKRVDPELVKPKRELINNFVRDVGYIHTLAKLEPGGTARWVLDEHAIFQSSNPLAARARNSFGASVNAWCKRNWGEDNYICAEKDGVLEVLRVV